MKHLLASLFGLIALSAQDLYSAPAQRQPSVYIAGRGYISLEQWARARSLETKWISRNQIQVSGAANRITVLTDSRRIILNGVSIWLSEPVLIRDGRAFLAEIDFAMAIHPVLYPAKMRPQARIKSVCIDPGHGGKDPGNRGGSQQEKKYTLLLAREVGAQLANAGFRISFTRTLDRFVDLPARPDFANRRGADLFLSLHFNSAPAEASGVEVYCMTPARTASTNARGEGTGSRTFVGNLQNDKNVLLAYYVQKSLISKLRAEDRGVRRARFAVLKSAQMPAVLIEGGFMSNPAEARKIYDSAYRKRIAQAVVEGVLTYRRLVES